MCYEKIEYSLKTCPHSIMHSTQHWVDKVLGMIKEISS